MSELISWLKEIYIKAKTGNFKWNNIYILIICIVME